jgi:hypothetical protein
MSDQLLAYQKSYLLLLLYQAEGQKLPSGKLKEKAKAKAAINLTFDDSSLHQALEALVENEEVRQKPAKKAASRLPAFRASYTLTERGKQRLFASEQYPTAELKMTGQFFNDFMAAVKESPFRESAAPQEPAKSGPVAPPQPSASADLTDTILREFRELLREKYSRTGMVPIHEVRQRIAERLGTEAARHDFFDAQLHRLRQADRLRMVPISFLGDATPEQLNDSVPGVNETLFYLEPAQDEYSLR